MHASGATVKQERSRQMQWTTICNRQIVGTVIEHRSRIWSSRLEQAVVHLWPGRLELGLILLILMPQQSPLCPSRTKSALKPCQTIALGKNTGVAM